MRSKSKPVVPFAVLAGIVCLAAASYGAENAITIGHAEGLPGETVRVPVRMTNDIGVCSVFLAWTYDPEVLAFVTPTIEGTASETLPVGFFSYEKVEDGVGTTLILTLIFTQMGFGFTGFTDYYPPAENALILWLRFRIRSSAPAGDTAVEFLNGPIPDGNQEGSTLVTVDNSALPAAYRDGVVTVNPPAGFRPPEIISCTQIVERVELVWEDLAAYDGIEIERDGATVASLPAGTTEWTDPSPPRGLRVYRLTATKGGVRSVGVECEIEVGPAVVPPPRDLTCIPEDGQVALSWRRGACYDRIRVMRGRIPIAVLAGDAEAYTDRDGVAGPGLYEVMGELEGHTSAAARCVAGGSSIIRAADVLAEPGEQGVRVPIRVTTMDPIQGVQICVIAPAEGLIAGTGYTFEGSLTEAIGYDVVLADNEGDRVRVAIIYDRFPPYERKDFPPSVDAPILSVLIDVPLEAQPGDAIPLSFGVCGRPGAVRIETCFVVPNGISGGPSSYSVLPEYVSGAVWVAGSGVPSVGNLRFDPLTTAKGPQSVRLSWRNAGAYDAITVERNGQVVAELPGDAESFIDALEANRVYLYRLTSHREGRPSLPATLVVNTFPGNVLFRRGDANADGEVNIADPVRLLAYLYAFGDPPSCADAADADDTGRLDLADPIYLLNFLFAGGPEPPIPGPRVDGFDPTEDELRCP